MNRNFVAGLRLANFIAFQWSASLRVNATGDSRSEKYRPLDERFEQNGLDSYNQPPDLNELPGSCST